MQLAAAAVLQLLQTMAAHPVRAEILKVFIEQSLSC